MLSENVLIEILDDGHVEGTVVESTQSIELIVESEADVQAVPINEYIEFDDGRGPKGFSAYQVAVLNGFVGTEAEWLVSLIGTDGESAYQIAVDNGFVGTESEWLESLIGSDGEIGFSQFVIETGGAYPTRPNADPVVFVGALNPDDLGLMTNAGDVYISTNAPGSVLHYVTDTELAAATIDGGTYSTPLNRIKQRRGTNAQWTSSNPVLQAGEEGFTTDFPYLSKIGDGATAWNSLTAFYRPTSQVGVNRDLRWSVPAGHTSIDEFNDDSINVNWVTARSANIPAGAVPKYTELGDALSVKYGVDTGSETVTSDGASARHAGLLFPLSQCGGSLAVGDAVYTAFGVQIRGNANYRMSGLVLSNTATGTGAQLYYRWWTGPSLGFRVMTNWETDTPLGGVTDYNPSTHAVYYLRIVRMSTTTWRADFSSDGIRWINGSANGTWAFEPTHIGFAESQWATAVPSVTSYEFIRRVSGVS